MKTPHKAVAVSPPNAPKDSAPNNLPVFNPAVSLDLIAPDPRNRDQIKPENVAAIAASIEAVGLLQPIVLRSLGKEGYRIIAGEHRWRACKLLKRKTIIAQVYENETDLEAAKKKAVENAQRVDLTPIERAKRFQELTELGSSQMEIGMLFGGLSQPVVANALRLLELPQDVQQLISEGKLSEAHGVSVARFVRWPKVCSFIAKHAAQNGWNSKQLAGRDLPFDSALVRAGLAHGIATGTYYSDTRHYVLPKDFTEDPAFFGANGAYSSYYLKPDSLKNGAAADKWAALKPKLDAELDKKEKASAKREDGKQSKMNPAEAAKRKKVIADNKQARTETALGRAAVFEQVRKYQADDKACLQVVVMHAFRSHYAGNRAEEVAKELGVALPKGFNEQNLEHVAKIAPVDLVRLAVGCILQDNIDHALRFASGIEKVKELAHVLGTKKTAKVKQAAADQLAAAAAAKAAKKKGGAK